MSYKMSTNDDDDEEKTKIRGGDPRDREKGPNGSVRKVVYGRGRKGRKGGGKRMEGEWVRIRCIRKVTCKIAVCIVCFLDFFCPVEIYSTFIFVEVFGGRKGGGTRKRGEG